jgi:hypothetical protein
MLILFPSVIHNLQMIELKIELKEMMTGERYQYIHKKVL